MDSLSTDGTPEMLRALGCRVISERCDLGTGRNVAVREARGEVVLVNDHRLKSVVVDPTSDRRSRPSSRLPERGPRPEGGENVNRNEWLAFLRSNDTEAKELLALHPGMKPPDESTWREAMKALWKDPGFRARHAAAVSVAQTRRWLAWRRHRKGDP